MLVLCAAVEDVVVRGGARRGVGVHGIGYVLTGGGERLYVSIGIAKFLTSSWLGIGVGMGFAFYMMLGFMVQYSNCLYG